MSDASRPDPVTDRLQEVASTLGDLRLDELLGELQERLARVVSTRDRMQDLLDAVLAIGTELDLDTTLHRIVSAAAELVQARYGALGVLGPGGEFTQFVHVGIDAGTAARMGPTPRGRGLLGQVTRDPRPLRLADLAQHPASIGFPEGHPPMRSFLAIPIRVRDEVFGNLYLTEKLDGGEFGQDDEVVLRALAAAAGVTVENARLFDQARLRHRWLQASSEITTELLSGVSTADGLRLIAQRAMEISRADCALIVLARHGTSSGQARVEAVAGEADIEVGIPVSTDGPVLASLTGDTPVLEADVSAAPVSGLKHVLPGYGPALAVPLHSGEAGAGAVIALRRKDSRPFGPGQVPLLASFADQTAIALELAAKNRAQRQLDVFGDRDRIARDLHDHVIQRLFATGLSLQGTLRRATDTDVRRRLQQSVEQLDDTVREIRTAIFDLHSAPEADDPVSLRRRLLDTVADASSGAGFTPAVRMSGQIDTAVPAAYFEHAEAVVREAVTNALRHGEATAITVSIDTGTDLTIEVRDNGRGLGAGSSGNGLRNLRDRAVQLSGTLELTDADPTGTLLSWRVPLLTPPEPDPT
ncbi:GAF domain-containing protein [Saccharopolyspora gloriosae]|uniref:Signal transduction histidine kinase n=1 Tax=Saccharopolyspora gloriosae TaxID=455344 RepID=A0A840NGW6_9PSEU|nr:GAF domain-containing protein [Saccharopolyspora gloriosae]MBB5069498.1 signal transduction histidine kinase [Saccharopolyspora gloriosae]